MQHLRWIEWIWIQTLPAYRFISSWFYSQLGRPLRTSATCATDANGATGRPLQEIPNQKRVWEQKTSKKVRWERDGTRHLWVDYCRLSSFFEVQAMEVLEGLRGGNDWLQWSRGGVASNPSWSVGVFGSQFFARAQWTYWLLSNYFHGLAHVMTGKLEGCRKSICEPNVPPNVWRHR